MWDVEMFCSTDGPGFVFSDSGYSSLGLIILLFQVLLFVFVGFREFPLCFSALVESGSRFDAVYLYDAVVFSLSWFIIANCINNGFPCICLRSGPSAFPC